MRGRFLSGLSSGSNSLLARSSKCSSVAGFELKKSARSKLESGVMADILDQRVGTLGKDDNI